MHFTSACTLLAAFAVEFANGTPSPVLVQRSESNPYQPYNVPCPTGNIIRPATSINCDEASYIHKRKPLADQSLQKWLQKTWGSEVPVCACDLPAVALVLGGGGVKAGLLSAGIVQALDSRDSSSGVSGLLQSMTYWSALSGGSITLESMVGNNFETVSELRKSLWNTNYQNPTEPIIKNKTQVVKDLAAKHSAGFPVSFIDVYGQIFSYAFIGGPQGGSGKTWSAVPSMPAFQYAELPFPVVTSTNGPLDEGLCSPTTNGTIWEYGPYEFGSWYNDVAAFIPTKYMGTDMIAGKAAKPGQCVTNFDNQGLITGMCGNVIAKNASHCVADQPMKPDDSFQTLFVDLLKAAIPGYQFTTESTFGIVPNPFYKYPASTSVNNDTNLYMEDGGNSNQAMPIWPWLQPERTVDVMIAADINSNSADDTTLGNSLYVTYQNAQYQGLARMPLVPTTNQIAAQNLTSHARFFGCDQKDAATIIWLPDSNTTHYDSGVFAFPPPAIDNLVQLGDDMSTQTGTADWPNCLACAIMKKKMSDLPKSCTACFAKYCWSG